MNRTMTVTQLSSYLKGVFDDEELLHDVTLTGEVAEVSYSDRHTFLVLAENDRSVRCVRFNSRDSIQKGSKIALRGTVRFYDKRSSVTFSYTEYHLCGDGEKNAKLLELKDKLYKLGYFENRPQLPRYIINVAAITSADGAAVRDLIRVVSDKSPFVRIRVYPVKVQGAGAAQMMVRAIKKLQSYKLDAIVLCRGGGSDEDLDSFNDEALATAVALSAIPVISAIGHEVDYTLCDFCAGTRAGTPSMAGEVINARAAALIEDIYSYASAARSALDEKLCARNTLLSELCSQVTRAVTDRIEERKNDIAFTAHRGYYALEKKLALNATRLRGECGHLVAAADKPVTKKRDGVKHLEELLRALDPHRIIRAGYAAVILNGRTVTNVAQLSAGDSVHLVFADGSAAATVNNIDKK